MFYVELIFFNALQFYSDGVLARLRVVDIASSVRSKVGMSILHTRDLVLPMNISK